MGERDHAVGLERVERVVVEPEALGEHFTGVFGEAGRRAAHADGGAVGAERSAGQPRARLDLREHRALGRPRRVGQLGDGPDLGDEKPEQLEPGLERREVGNLRAEVAEDAQHLLPGVGGRDRRVGERGGDLGQARRSGRP